ncbi:MAG: GH1 family beta-glucosidase [Sporichthyaceae bacterium]
MSSHLPEGNRLVYGTATASYQVEGATTTDGRGPSIWDTFTATPGTIKDASDGSVACASYERLDEDLDLLGGLGVAYYRFSVAWPRIQPTGGGAVEPRGLAYYDRMVDGLLARGIAPMATLYHWDLPQALEDAGGWPERATAERFADYAAIVHEHLGDRVAVWTTHNEPWCAAYLGYAAGKHAPGRQEADAAHRAAHHLLLGHGLAAARLHEAGADTVGIVLNLTPVWPERPEAAEAADGVDAIHNRVWLGPLVDGAYDERLRALAPPLDDSSVVRDGDLALVQGSADYLGVNYYTPARIDVGDGAESSAVGQDTLAYPRVAGLQFAPRGPRTAMGWEVEPRGLEELLVSTHRRTGLPLVVAENGAAYDDEVRAPDGSVDDQDRIAYLRDHVAAVERAREAGADVRAYIAWTLLDNFEWAEGYTKKFGLVEVSPDDQTRTPKASYRWYANLAHVGLPATDAPA